MLIEFLLSLMFVGMIYSRHPCPVGDYKETMIRASGRCNRGVTNPHLTKEPQLWQEVRNRQVIVFSAYMERRPLADGHSVRIIASGHQSAYNSIGQLYCQLWYTDDYFDRAYTTGPAIYDVIYPSTAWHQAWSSHFIICPLPSHMSHKTPLYVSVAPSPCSENRTNALLILNRDAKVKKRNTHAHCISTIYNAWNDAEMLTEMLEASKIIGHSEIIVYVLHAGERVNQVLRSYTNDNKSGVRIVHYPFDKTDANVWCQRGAVNDCFYRLSQTHQYVTIGDMDELHVPRSTRTLSRLIHLIGKADAAAYHFQHKYFRRNYTEGVYPQLITQSSLYTTDIVHPPGRIRCKSIYNTDLAIKLDLHYAYSIVEGSRELTLDPDVALLHHYRVHKMSNMRDHDTDEYRYIRDDYMMKYGAPLRRKVEKRLRNAGVYDHPH